MNNKRAVFIDRDGVINRTIFKMGAERAPYTLDEFQLHTGVQQAVQELKAAGFLVIVATNQPDVARRWVTREMVDIINHHVREVLAVDDVKVCFHTESDHCECRKPKPGMLLEAAKEQGISLKKSFMIGDRYSDVEAGKRAGCRSILVGPGDKLKSEVKPDFVASSLLEAVHRILSEEKR